MKRSSLIEERCNEVAHLLKQVAHPNRLKILCYLIEGDKTVSELEELCGASQSSVSQYLAKMKSEKILSSRRDGQSIIYSLSNKEIRKFIEKMKDVFC